MEQKLKEEICEKSVSTKIVEKKRENKSLKELRIALMLLQYVIFIWKIKRTDGRENACKAIQ